MKLEAIVIYRATCEDCTWVRDSELDWKVLERAQEHEYQSGHAVAFDQYTVTAHGRTV